MSAGEAKKIKKNRGKYEKGGTEKGENVIKNRENASFLFYINTFKVNIIQMIFSFCSILCSICLLREAAKNNGLF